MEYIDVAKVKKIHFVGIKGIAMAALAVHARERGYKVTGSDVTEEFPSDEVLAKAKIKPLVGFSEDHIKQMTGSDPVMVIYTGAHGGRENIEVDYAIKKGIQTLPHGKALGLFMKGKRQISVSGSHGKTTTAAMVATILSRAGFNPSYAIGCGEIRDLGLPGHYGKGDWFIAEADEYVTDPGHDDTPRFLWQKPEILVVTNIDYDHPDVYTSLDQVLQAFKKLRDKVPLSGELILSSDDDSCRQLIWLDSSVSLVGLSARADYHVTNIHFSEGRAFFQLESAPVFIGEFILQVPGRHNLVNAAMAAIVASRAGVSWDIIRQSLYEFGGVKRRFEKIGEAQGTIFYDDYAHHPKEIIATLTGAREWFPKRRIIAIFQPHTYSRTKALLGEFAKAFSQSDLVILTDIYASAREHETMGLTGKSLVGEAIKFHKNVIYAKDKQAVLETLQRILKLHDIVIFMGAGDVYNWEREIIGELSNPTNKYQSDQ